MKRLLATMAATVLTMGGLANVPAFAAMKTTGAVPIVASKNAQIVVNGNLFAKDVPEFVRNQTTWMPIEVVIQALSNMGVNVTYDGKQLLLDDLAMQSGTLRGIHPGHIDVADGSFLLTNVPIATVDVSGQQTTYVPIWYINRALNQGTSGYHASWKDSQLTLGNGAVGAPTRAEIAQVMRRTIEVGSAGEYFVLSGKPVSIIASNGDTVTAAVGTRYPTADGYGQVVFFFHNHQFVGLDSNMEKTQIKSIQPSADGMSFDVTYVNYKPDDALYAPSLPPATVTYGFDGNAFSANQPIPSGALNQLRVRVGGTTQATSTMTNDAKEAIQNALPSGAKLLNLPGKDSPYLAVDLDGDGQNEYAAAYQKHSTAIGLVVVGKRNGKWQVLWNKLTNGFQLRELNAGAMTGDGSQEIAMQSYVGDGSNDVLVLKWVDGALKPILHTAGSADIGDFNQDGQMEVATWTHDTGPLEVIQLYAWDASKQAYEKANNVDYPRYFGDVVMPYYQSVMKQTGKQAVPPKMAWYAKSTTYEAMGVYGAAVKDAKVGLSSGNNAYPDNSVLQAILNTASAKLAKVERYMQLPKATQNGIHQVINRYTASYNPVAVSTPMVSQTKNGAYQVQVIGVFHNIVKGKYVTATELHFVISANGSNVRSLTAVDALGNTVWQET